MAKKLRLPVPRFGLYNPIDHRELNRQFDAIKNHLNGSVSGSNIKDEVITKEKLSNNLTDGTTITFDTTLQLNDGWASRLYFKPYDFSVTGKHNTYFSTPRASSGLSSGGKGIIIVPTGRQYLVTYIPGPEAEITNYIFNSTNPDIPPDVEVVEADYCSGFCSNLLVSKLDGTQLDLITCRTTVKDNIEEQPIGEVSTILAPPGTTRAFIDTSSYSEDKIKISAWNGDIFNVQLVAIPL